LNSSGLQMDQAREGHWVVDYSTAY